MIICVEDINERVDDAVQADVEPVKRLEGVVIADGDEVADSVGNDEVAAGT